MSDLVNDLFECRRVIDMLSRSLSSAEGYLTHLTKPRRRASNPVLLKLRQAKALAALALKELDTRSGADYASTPASD